MGRFGSFAAHAMLYLPYTASLFLFVITDARAGDPIAGDPVVNFSLPAERLPRALIDYYYQCGVAPGFASTPDMENAKSNPVFGVMRSSVALDKMLKGTGFTYRVDVDTGDSVDVIPIRGGDRARPHSAAGASKAAGSEEPRAG